MNSKRLTFCFVLFWSQLIATVRAKDSSPYYGYFIGKLSNREENIFGHLYAVDKNTVFIQNFTYLDDSPLFVYAGTLGNDGGYTKTGYPLRSLDGELTPLTRSEGNDVTLIFPSGKSLFEVDWLGIISRKNKALYSRVLVDELTKESIPRPQSLATLSGPNGLSSSEVVVMDTRTLMIKDLTFGGLAPDTHFMVGTAGLIPNEVDGFFIPDERGTEQSLGQYKNRTILLALPKSGPDFRSIRWISIWSRGLGRSLADIIVPPPINVPPALEKIGIDPKSTLNCELLSDVIGLQLRWTITDESGSIILQLVSKTDSDRYIAFGIKNSGNEDKQVSGDVVVGWVNARTGKGEIDDYFLAGDQLKCDDGAESCPDTSKPGGSKQVELLNAVSRNNYTMLTFRRSLNAQDQYDLDISTIDQQSVFWSVGYKSANMRKKNKPMKNQGPKMIEFGRRPNWNCPKDDEDPQTATNQQGVETETDKFDSNFDEKFEKPEVQNLTPETAVRTPVDRSPPRSRPPRPRQQSGSSPRPRPPAPSPTQSPVSFGSSVSDLSLWLSPPTQPEVKTGGFLPNVGDQLSGMESGGFRPNVVPPTFESNVGRSSTGQSGLPGVSGQSGQSGQSGRDDGFSNFRHDEFDEDHDEVPEISESNWSVPPISCRDTRSKEFPLYVQLGPAAGHRGNQGVSSNLGGTAIYINGLMAPDIYLERGRTYTFVVETGLGSDPEQTFHPVYITSDPSGGHQLKADFEAKAEKIFGGSSLDRNGIRIPTSMGRLCRWTSPRAPMTFASYHDFHHSLAINCEQNNLGGSGDQPSVKRRRIGKEIRSGSGSGSLEFTPTREMPDTIYYQSFMEKHLGGVIHLIDHCNDDEVESTRIPHLTTFRPNLIQHLSETKKPEENPSNRKRRKQMSQKRPKFDQPNVGNRRVGVDYDEYDANDFSSTSDDALMNDATSQLLAQCKERQSQKEVRGRVRTNRRRHRRESDAKISGSDAKTNRMPVFEHFPVQDNGQPREQQKPLPKQQQHQQQQQQQQQESILSSGKLKNKKKAVVVEPEIDAEIEDEDFLEEKCRNLEGLLLNGNNDNDNPTASFESEKSEGLLTSSSQLSGNSGSGSGATDKIGSRSSNKPDKRRNKDPPEIEIEPEMGWSQQNQDHQRKEIIPLKTPASSVKTTTLMPPTYLHSQIDPSLLHNGYLFDQAQAHKRWEEGEEEEVDNDDSANLRINPEMSKRHPSTQPPPKLPPPGGDVPPYMLKEIFSMQNKRVVIDEQPLDEDEEDEEVPVRGPNGFPPKRNVGGPMPKNSDLNPLSKLMSPLRDILPRNWFQEEKEKSDEEIFSPQIPLRKSGHKVQQQQYKPTLPPPVFSPPGNFPSFRKDKRKGNGPRLPSPNFQSQFQGPIQQKYGPINEQPFRGGGGMRGPSSRSQKGPKQHRNKNDPFRHVMMHQPSSVSEQRMLRFETDPEIRSSASTSSNQLYVEVDKTDEEDEEIEDDDSDDEDNEGNVDKVPMEVEETTLRNYLEEVSDRATAPAADVGSFHSKLSKIEDEDANISQLVSAQIQTEIQTENAAGEEDLMQPLSSERKSLTPNKEFLESDPQPSTLGLGFDPSAIQPESGFKPILEQGGGLPTLAFSVLDGVGRPFAEDHHQVLLDQLDDFDDVTTEENNILRRSGTTRNGDQVFKHSEEPSTAIVAHGDRGNVVVDVPAPVVPYVPTFMNRPDQVPDQFENIPARSKKNSPKSRKNPVRSRIGTSTQKTIPQDSSTLSEDFDAFRSVTDRTTTESSKKRTNDLAYQETDRIDVPNLLLPGAKTSSDPLSNKVSVAVPSVSEPEFPYKIDPQAKIYSKSSAPYGKQYPSYLPNNIQTLLDTPSGGLKVFDTNSDVVYGKFHEGVNKIDPESIPTSVSTPEPEFDSVSDEILTPEDSSAYPDDYLEDPDEYSGIEDVQLMKKEVDLSRDNQRQQKQEMDLSESQIDRDGIESATEVKSMPSLVQLWQQFQQKQQEGRNQR